MATSEKVYFPSVRIKRFKAIDDLNLNSLARINLIAGDNNVGKSTLLEGLYIFAMEGDMDVMAQVACERMGYPLEVDVRDEKIRQSLMFSFFPNWKFELGKSIFFQTVQGKALELRAVYAYRTDIEGKADLSEEVIRLLGYDRLPSTLPLMEMTEGKLNEKQKLIRTVRNLYCQLGLQDCLTYTLVSTQKKDNAILGLQDPIQLASPMSEERRWIRTSILPSLLDVVSYNHARTIKDVNVFELSNVAGTQGTRMHLAFVLSGLLQQTRWLQYELPSDFYTGKGLIETLFDHIGISAARVSFEANTEDVVHFHPYQSAKILIDKKCIGYLGKIHPQYAKETDCKDVIMAELDFDALVDIKKAKIKFAPVSKYPSVQRDLAFVIDRNMPVKKVVSIINKNARYNKEEIIRNVEVFDVYQGEHVAKDEKSVALSITFQSDTHTLKDEEINEVFENILQAIQIECDATLRS